MSWEILASDTALSAAAIETTDSPCQDESWGFGPFGRLWL
jgi:hypothetical protein